MMTTGQGSKWLQALSSEPETSENVSVVAPQPPTGPQHPQKGVRLRTGSTVPRQEVQGPAPAFWVMGTHGGAGESTLAALLDGAVGTERTWPIRAERPPTPDQDRVVLVCRSNMTGLRSAQQVAIEYASGALPGVLAGLVIVADAPTKLPKVLSDMAKILTGTVPHTWRLPWVDTWRRELVPEINDLPRNAKALLDHIQLHAVAVGNTK
ncbi:DUF6668 family protein [Pseudarthrobacter sp. PS3-L1]|uniref:DUF6668 family protein n=1 Tax=Pseudarthrobacter sp. PS3-L1 TaxID=3046207 RepID=UPI0024B971E2|nr:DUF6668 family protein [Pseudarthrobacter sp. PS3-L1]MDJ0322118.1 hypothetical protein [Pseudarthrobacter sp. PS3-L1]